MPEKTPKDQMTRQDRGYKCPCRDVKRAYVFVLLVLEFYGPVNNEVISSRSFNSGTVPGQAKIFQAVNQF